MRWNLEQGVKQWLRHTGQATLLGAALGPLVACGGFFQCENKAACPASTSTGTGTGTTPTSSVDFAFVSYTTTANASVITGYNIANGTLAAINTVTLPFVPIAMAVNSKNNLLYVASVSGYSNPGIYTYAIGTDGTLTAFSGTPVVNDLVGAMTISPDGNYLYTVQTQNQTLTQYSVGTSGGLTASGALTVLALSCAPVASAALLPTCGVAVSPKKDYVVASLGSQGDAVFNYSSTGGIPNQSFATVATPNALTGDFAVAMDSNDNAYVAETNSLAVYGVASTGLTSRGTYTFPTGSIPRSTVVDSTSSFVYTAAVGTSKITGFATGTSAALTTLSNSPYSAPANVAALAIDSTDAYLIGVGYDAAAGVQLYSVASTTGALAPLASAPTSTVKTYPVLVAVTH